MMPHIMKCYDFHYSLFVFGTTTLRGWTWQCLLSLCMAWSLCVNVVRNVEICVCAAIFFCPLCGWRRSKAGLYVLAPVYLAMSTLILCYYRFLCADKDHHRLEIQIAFFNAVINGLSS